MRQDAAERMEQALATSAARSAAPTPNVDDGDEAFVPVVGVDDVAERLVGAGAIGLDESRQGLLLALVTLVFFLDALTYGIVLPVLPSLGAGADLGSAGIGLVFACHGVAYLVVGPLSGWLSDRGHARGAFLAGTVSLLLATLGFGYDEGAASLFVSRFLQGAGAAAVWVAGCATLAATFPARARGHAIGVASSGTGLGALVGPLAGGALLDTGGPRAPFLVTAGLAGTTMVALAVFLPRVSERSLVVTPAQSKMVLRRAGAWLLAGVAVGIGFGAIGAALPVDLVRRLGLSGSTVGLLFAATSLVFVVSTQSFARVADRAHRSTIVAVGWLIVVVALAVLGLPATPGGVLSVTAVLGIGLGMMSAPMLPALSDALETGDDARPGRAVVAYNLSVGAGIALGAALVGVLGGVLPFARVMPLVALALLVCGAGARVFQMRVRRSGDEVHASVQRIAAHL